MAVTLETERLVLRAFEAADFDAYAAMCGDPEVMRFRIELQGKPVLLYRITRDEWAKGAAACR